MPLRPRILPLLVATSVALALATAVVAFGGSRPGSPSDQIRSSRTGGSGGSSTPATTPRPVSTAEPPTTARTTQPPEPALYRLHPDEVQRRAKLVAVRFVERLTTYERGTSLERLTARAGRGDAALQARLAQRIRPLVHPHRWSRGTVVYPQMGGLRNGRASVMVVVRQETGVTDEALAAATRTLDVRLLQTTDGWRVEDLASAGGTAAPRPRDLPAVARRVLDDPRIELPDSARWDIHRGEVSAALLQVMRDLAERTPYGVITMHSGHPVHVFGTGRYSAHTSGRAVDIYRIGRHPVVAQRSPGSSAHRAAAWLFGRSDVGQVGSPWELGGPGVRSFTDDVHQDHLHVAVP